MGEIVSSIFVFCYKAVGKKKLEIYINKLLQIITFSLFGCAKFN